MKMPALQFYPADWRKDLAVQSLKYFDRGVWFEMLCLMHESSERGVLILNGIPMGDEAVAQLLGLDIQLFKQTLDTLLKYGAARRRDSDGAIYNKRMVEDEKLCEKRREAGKLGGNPALLNQSRNQKTTKPVKQKPTPSSSSSSSSSLRDTPIPPDGGSTSAKENRGATGLRTFLDNCRQTGATPIPDDDPVFAYADKVKLPRDFLHLQWVEFKDRYQMPGAKRYKSWPTVFLKSVKGNWFKLWFVDNDGHYALTTVGQQAKRDHAEAA